MQQKHLMMETQATDFIDESRELLETYANTVSGVIYLCSNYANVRCYWVYPHSWWDRNLHKASFLLILVDKITYFVLPSKYFVVSVVLPLFCATGIIFTFLSQTRDLSKLLVAWQKKVAAR